MLIFTRHTHTHTHTHTVLVSSASNAMQMTTRVNTEMSINPKLKDASNWNLSSQFLGKEFETKVIVVNKQQINVQ